MQQSDDSLRGLTAAIVRGAVDGIRANRVAAAFALIAVIVTTVLSLGSQYDERPRYREVTLPEIRRYEGRYLDAIRDAENASNEDWQVFYFVEAHIKAKEALQLIRQRYPHSRAGIRAHTELIHYYELIDEDFAILRTQMSLDQKVDFIAEWRQLQAKRWPLHEQWEKWMAGGLNKSGE